MSSDPSYFWTCRLAWRFELRLTGRASGTALHKVICRSALGGAGLDLLRMSWPSHFHPSKSHLLRFRSRGFLLLLASVRDCRRTSRRDTTPTRFDKLAIEERQIIDGNRKTLRTLCRTFGQVNTGPCIVPWFV